MKKFWILRKLIDFNELLLVKNYWKLKIIEYNDLMFF